jgi:tRNA1(Val) A37 N6-methylase TrmN6
VAPDEGGEDSPTTDFFLSGKVRVRQPKVGYRAGLDAVLLGAAVSEGERLLEAGCGAGVALLCAAARLPHARFVGVERDAAAASLARWNAEANGVIDRVEIVEGDALELDVGVFDGVFLNPPYFAEGEGRPPHRSRLGAFVTDAPLGRWVGILANRLRGGAPLTIIHRAERLDAILTACEGRLGGVRVFPVFPRAGEPASRVLVRAIKGSRAPLRLLQGLTVHGDAGSAFTPAAEALLRGDGALAWL